MIAVDSNIWIYYLDPTLPEHEKVKPALEKVLQHEDILTTTIIWMEVAHYLFKVSSLPKAELSQRIKKLLKLATMRVEDFSADMLSMTIDTLEENYRHKIGGRDAAILATMKKNSVNRLITHDRGFVGLVEVVDPVVR